MAVAFALRDGHGKPKAAQSSSAAPSMTATSQPGEGGPRGTTKIQPVVPGWQVVLNGDLNVACDVPKDWTVLGEGRDLAVHNEMGFPVSSTERPPTSSTAPQTQYVPG
ncbi:hypothetical protein GCM10009753_74520 [Streptantibioticus ferralitis]